MQKQQTLLTEDSNFVKSHSDKAMPKSLIPVVESLDDLGCDMLRFRWSRNGVPHLVLQLRSQAFSVCYFGRSKLYRVFFPYGESRPQKRHDCKTPQDVRAFVNSRTRGD